MWKSGEFKDLPEDVHEKQTAMEVTEKTVSFKSKDQDFSIYCQTVSPAAGSEREPPVLLLHGMRFSSQTWVDLRTPQTLAALGFKTLAIDLPGYAKSKDQKPLDDTAQFLRDVISALGLDRPVVVSPSMSGSYTLPYLMGGGDPAGWAGKARGYVPVAPIFTDTYTDVYKQCQIPTLIVQGSKDVPMGSTASEHLSALPNSYLHIMEGGGHPCYLDNPKEWHTILYNFLQAIEK